MPVRLRIGIFFTVKPMNKTDYFQVGLIKKPHGLKGEVNLSLGGETSLEGVTALFLEIEGSLVPYFVESFSGNGEKSTLKFEDINSLEEAKKIGGKKIFLLKTARPRLPKGEFYDDELIGFDVVDESAGKLGKLEEIIAAGANRLFVVREKTKEVLIPENGPFIQEINKKNRTITVILPDGFLDMNT